MPAASLKYSSTGGSGPHDPRPSCTHEHRGPLNVCILSVRTEVPLRRVEGANISNYIHSTVPLCLFFPSLLRPASPVSPGIRMQKVNGPSFPGDVNGFIVMFHTGSRFFYLAQRGWFFQTLGCSGLIEILMRLYDRYVAGWSLKVKKRLTTLICSFRYTNTI